MYDSWYGRGGESVIEREKGGISHKTPGSKPFHVEFSWRLNEFMEGAIMIEVGSLFRSLTIRTDNNFAFYEGTD